MSQESDRVCEPLEYMSPEQYREKYGREPVDVGPEPTTEPWTGAGAWPGWTAPFRPPTVVELMAEYTGMYLCNGSPERDPFGRDSPLSPSMLEVTPGLIQRLDAWNLRISGRRVRTMEAEWWDEGWSLAQELQREFDTRGVDVQVRFRDRDRDRQNRAVRDGGRGD